MDKLSFLLQTRIHGGGSTSFRICPQELSIDPSKSPAYSMKEFRQLLRNAYSLNKIAAIKLEDHKSRPPWLLIVSRNRTRSFANTDEIAAMGRDLGYQVVVAEADSKVARVAQVVNSCDVMMGVHGAGLTNMVFLPENAILIQINPFGVIEWIVRDGFKYTLWLPPTCSFILLFIKG
ncbi:hypothetical protein COLO4_19662 [Corchorus olitorius]|uniref:Glycosyltransferase 61 catalytic domain-containing protein n=1 Tax=Corchorus olitorius TaxID=93759 RepID=A0A1R3J472_9ROSI|nr:hypothetical protein COLO4_19662 [Corchorus olitorius]